MNIQLTEHAEELLEAVQEQSHQPAEVILEHALEILVREKQIKIKQPTPDEAQRRAVAEMLEFVQRNRVSLDTGLSVKDLIREGRRI